VTEQRRLVTAYSNWRLVGDNYITDMDPWLPSGDDKLAKLFAECITESVPLNDDYDEDDPETWAPKEIEITIRHPRYQVARAILTMTLVQRAAPDDIELGVYRIGREIIDDGLTPVKAIMELVRYSTLMSRALVAGAPAGQRPATENDYTRWVREWAARLKRKSLI
jgi:hypothetical protein